ncbi:MAG: DUF3429 domain-containing protein [Methylotenera sp.]|nr:DUF3429 domain-containing protein [Methylotenera sp.]
MKQTNPQRLPQLLGYLGLLPFIVPSFFLLYDPEHAIVWRDLLLSYAAVILSFVGALHWAFAMTLDDLSEKSRRWLYVWSVIPALAGWVALALPAWHGALLMAMVFALNLLQDIHLCRMADIPAWYLPLRRNLSSVASACLTYSTLA